MNKSKQASRKSEFDDGLKLMASMLNESPIRVKDIKYILDAGFKLSMEFERIYKSKAKWRLRAEKAEAALKAQ